LLERHGCQTWQPSGGPFVFLFVLFDLRFRCGAKSADRRVQIVFWQRCSMVHDMEALHDSTARSVNIALAAASCSALVVRDGGSSDVGTGSPASKRPKLTGVGMDRRLEISLFVDSGSLGPPG
jgi:hypothetical protein